MFDEKTLREKARAAVRNGELPNRAPTALGVVLESVRCAQCASCP